MKIGIVNDTAMAVEVMRRIVDASATHEVAWTARDGAEAVARCAEMTPDLVLMDLYMPTMNGLEATRRIMAATPCPILIVTATVEGHAARVFETLAAGAVDAVATPEVGASGALEGEDRLLAKLAMIQSLFGTPRQRTRTPHATPAVTPPRDPQPFGASSGRPPLVAIGASAGGPGALATILHDLPESFGGAVVIVQHVDEQFAEGMARWLDTQSAIPVRIARDGEAPVPGTALIAGTDSHLVLGDGGTLRYVAEPRATSYRPSVDVFFQSIPAHWRGGVIGVVLTGMGRDGARGLRSLRDSGATTIAQDRESSAVYGMPRAAAELEAAMEVLPLSGIASRLTTLVTDGFPRRAVARA